MTNAQECRSYYRKPRGRAIHLVQASRHNSVGKIEHTLTVERVAAAIERGRCEVTGLPFNLEHGWNPFAPSIDRKDPERGYTDDNVQVVVWAYNAAKGNGTHEDVLRFARAVLATLLQIVLILSCVPAKAQTRPRPDQIRNWSQVAPPGVQVSGTRIQVVQLAMSAEALATWLEITLAKSYDHYNVAVTPDQPDPILITCLRPETDPLGPGCVGGVFWFTVPGPAARP